MLPSESAPMTDWIIPPIEVRKFKLNLVPPTLYLNEPLDGSTHSNGKILFTGTASDPYSGTWGSDIQDIWFDVSG